MAAWRVTIVMVRGSDGGLPSIPNREINPNTFPQGTRDVNRLSLWRCPVPFPLYFARHGPRLGKIATSCQKSTEKRISRNLVFLHRGQRLFGVSFVENSVKRNLIDRSFIASPCTYECLRSLWQRFNNCILIGWSVSLRETDFSRMHAFCIHAYVRFAR